MLSLELMTKKDCSLCDEAKVVLARVLKDFPARLKFTDIELDDDLLSRYREKIPVLLIEGKESFVYKVHEITLRRKLELAMKEARD